MTTKKTEETNKPSIEEMIKTLQAEQNNAINERAFCIRQTEQLAARINYLSGKIDALKEMEQ